MTDSEYWLLCLNADRNWEAWRKAEQERHGEKPKPEPSWLTQMGMHQYLTRTGEIREQRCDVSPDI